MKDSCKVLFFAGRVGQEMLLERFAPSLCAADFDKVPSPAEILSPKWLTAVLCGEHPGARVVEVKLERATSGTSQRRALRVTYNDVGHALGLPTALFTKSSEAFASRMLLGLTGIVDGESIFYRKIRPRLNLRSPHAYYARSDPGSYRSVVILNDLEAEGYSFPDPEGHRVNRTDAECMIEQMAIYHSAFWDSPELEEGEISGLRTSHRFQVDLNEKVGFEKRCRVGMERARAVVPAAIYSRRREIWPAYMRSLECNVQGPMTLLHQDPHVGNWMRDREGKMGLYDWQCVAKGGWALDVAYALVCALETGDRRAWERGLIERYLAHLRAQGARPVPSLEQAWLAYRQQPFHALAFGLFTIGRGILQARMQSEAYCLQSIQRCARMIADLNSLDSLV